MSFVTIAWQTRPCSISQELPFLRLKIYARPCARPQKWLFFEDSLLFRQDRPSSLKNGLLFFKYLDISLHCCRRLSQFSHINDDDMVRWVVEVVVVVCTGSGQLRLRGFKRGDCEGVTQKRAKMFIKPPPQLIFVGHCSDSLKCRK